MSGGGSLVSAEVRQAAVGAIGRKSLLQVDASAVAREVEKLPYVRTASVDRSVPHTLSIRITTYRPAAAVRSGKAAYLVSSDGRVLSQDVAKDSTLPVIRVAHGLALTPGQHVPAGTIVAALGVLRAVPHAFVHRVGHIHKLELGDAGLVAVIGRGDARRARIRRRLGAGPAGAGLQTLNLDMRVRVLPSHAPLDREGGGGYSRIASFRLRGPRVPDSGLTQERDIQPSSRG